MSNKNRNNDGLDAQRRAFADAFDLEADPLAKYEEQFQNLDVDPLKVYMKEVLESRGLSRQRENDYRRIFRQFEEHMQGQGRHPACANTGHITRFAEAQRANRGHNVGTIKSHLRALNRAYKYWQRESVFPHGKDFNPIEAAREKIPFREWQSEEPDKDHPNVPLEDLREGVRTIKHIRGRCFVCTQLKLGMRAGAICNSKLKDVSIQHPGIEESYLELGTHPQVRDYENAIYIPPADERDGNKSKRGRVLPLDDEMRQLLVQWLLVRPDNGEPWLFLSDQRHDQLWPTTVNDAWKTGFHPKYAETEHHEAVTSHFGRHWFSSFWRIDQDLNRELVKYMRGDAIGDAAVDYGEAIDVYLHTYYDDIEDIYRESVFKLGIGSY